MYWGYNFRNERTPNGKLIVRRYQTADIIVDGMEAETKYFVYIIGGSNHPGFPDLMAEK